MKNKIKNKYETYMLFLTKPRKKSMLGSFRQSSKRLFSELELEKQWALRLLKSLPSKLYLLVNIFN
jgi:hypothetical protein